MKKKLSTLLLTLLVLISTMPFTSWAETSLSDDICILATSDVHCQVERGYDKSGACTNIGYPGVAAYRDAMKAQYNNVILVDNGDSIQGDLIGFFNKGESIVNIMNAVGYSNDNRKVYDVEVGGKPIEKNKTYKLASNNFIIKSGSEVDTGDNSSITTYILIMAVALAGVVILIILKRKK